MEGVAVKEKKSLHVEMGQRIRNRREELKWSRETLSEKTDVSARFLACVENGQSGLSLESLGRMSCALGVSTDFLLFGSGTAPIPNDLADALASIPPDYHDLLSSRYVSFPILSNDGFAFQSTIQYNKDTITTKKEGGL